MRYILALILTLAPLCQLRAQILAPILFGTPAAGGSTPPAFVSSTLCDPAGNTTFACTATIPAGSFVVAGIAAYIGSLSGTVTFTCADNVDGSWGATDIQFGTVATSTRMAGLCHFANAIGGSTTVTLTLSQSLAGANAGVYLAWYSQGSLAGTLDKTSSNMNSSTSSFTSGSTATTTAANELLAGSCAVAASVTWTAGAGWTIRQTDTVSDPTAWEDQVVNATGAYAATMTLATGGPANGPCVIAAYK